MIARGALILAAGRQTRWHDDSAKHMADVAGEPSIVRLVRQTVGRGWLPTIVTRHGTHMASLPRSICIEPTKSLCHTILSVPKEVMMSTGLLLVGDAVLSKAAADQCMTRKTRGTRFVQNGPEIFSLRFDDPELVLFAAERAVLRAPHRDLRLRDLMAVLGGFGDPGYRETSTFSHEVDDWSTDLDDRERHDQILDAVTSGLVDDLP